MNATDKLIERLLKAAASVPQEAPDAPPFGLETRTLAARRTSISASELAGLLRFFRLGLGFASVLMMVIIALSLRDLAREPAAELVLPDVALNLALSQ